MNYTSGRFTLLGALKLKFIHKNGLSISSCICAEGIYLPKNQDRGCMCNKSYVDNKFFSHVGNLKGMVVFKKGTLDENDPCRSLHMVDLLSEIDLYKVLIEQHADIGLYSSPKCSFQ